MLLRISEALKTDDCDAYASKAKAYRKLAQEIKKEFQTRYIDADGDLKQKSQTAYLLALKLDLFPTEEARKKGVETLVRKIAGNGNRLSTGFVGTAILNQTLSQFGESNTAYDLLLQRNNPSWLYSIDQGATTTLGFVYQRERFWPRIDELVQSLLVWSSLRMDVPHNGRYRYRRNTSGIQAHRITAGSRQPSGSCRRSGTD
jgi:hypothetical protein